MYASVYLCPQVRKSGLGKGDLKDGIAEWEKSIVAAAGRAPADEDTDAVVEVTDAMQAVEVA